ncbi:MAG: MATE family efflux transporter [Planctomycetia bacterium]|nr:MATE family efflux transporter [Planctomycetia bacterium]
MQQNESEIYRSTQLLGRKYVEYLAPTLFMNIALAITNVMNATIIGNMLGSDALAASNLCMPAFSFINAVFNTVIMGACTLIVADKGAMKSDRADRSFTQLSIFGMGLMILLTLGIVLFLNPLAVVFTGGVSNREILALVKEYLFPLAFSFPLVFISLGGATILRTDGHPHFGAVIILIAGIINLAADLLFIYVFHWGMAGASWASVAGFGCASLFVIPYFFFRTRSLHYCQLGKKPLQGLGSIFLTGLPSGSTSLFLSARLLLLNMMVFRLFDSGGAAAFAVYFSTLYFANMFILGTTQAMQPISAMLFGEKDYSGLKGLVRMVLLAAIFIAVSFSLLFLFFPDFVGYFFGLKGEGLKLLPQALAALAIAFPFSAVNYFYLSYTQTIRRPGLGMIISFFGSIGFIAALSPIFYFVFPGNFWYVIPASEILTTILLYVQICRLCRRENVSMRLVKEDRVPTLDLSIKQSEVQAISLSEQVIRFSLEHGIDLRRANAAGVIVEETAINIIRHSGVKKQSGSSRMILDIVVRIDGEDIIGRFRDAGRSYNPLSIEDPPPESGIGLIHRLAKEEKYMRTLGFNIFYFRL